MTEIDRSAPFALPLVETVDRHASAAPDRPMFVTNAERWTIAELATSASRLAGELSRGLVVPGTYAALVADASPAFVTAYVAILKARGIPAIVDATGGAIDEIVGRLGASALVTTSAGVVAQVEASVTRVLVDVGPGRARLSVLGGGGPAPLPSSPAPMHVLFTSGSSAAPKGVAWSEARVLATFGPESPFWGPPEHRFGLLLPVSHAAGFHAVIACLLQGRALAFVDAPFSIASALSSLDALGAHGAKLTPTHVELILRSGLPPPPGLLRIQVSGAPIAPERLSAFADWAGPAQVREVYGLAEAGSVTVLPPERLREKAHTVGLPRTSGVRVCGPDGAPLPHGTSGEIAVVLEPFTSADGYVLGEQFPIKRIRDGVLFTGDRGYFDDDGFLVLEGRASELLKVGGRLVDARELERALAVVLAPHEVAIAAAYDARFGQVPVLFCAPSADALLPHDFAVRAARALPVASIPRYCFVRCGLPRTSAGKLQRGQLADEARAWARHWPERRLLGERLVPARALAGKPSVVLTDGLDEASLSTLGILDRRPDARAIGVHLDGRTPEPLGTAELRDGSYEAATGTRLLDWHRAPGLDAASLARIAGALASLALDLPGPPPTALIATTRDAAVREALLTSGFLPLEGDDSRYSLPLRSRT